MTLFEIEKLAFGQVEKLKQFPDLFEEFCGLAEGSTLSLADLLILNNYTDLRDFGGYHPTGESKQDEGCSLFSYRHPKIHLCGQTWDMHASAEPYVLSLSIQGDQKRPSIEILTVTGCMALAGVNQHSLSVLINNMHCSETSVSAMWPALVKGMLLKKTAKEALDFFVANLPCSGHNYLICDPKEAINVESTGRRVDITYRKEEPGVTFHTNHYVGPLKDVEILDRQSKTTHQRYQALEEFFSKVDERVTENDFLNFLFNPNPQYPIYIPKPKEPHGAMTCGGILYNPALKKGKVFKGAYSEGNIREFSWE